MSEHGVICIYFVCFSLINACHFLSKVVGIAASAAAIGDFSNAPVTTDLDKVHLASIYLATVIGSVTCTGSLVAFGKLDGRLASAPLAHPARDQINMGLGAGMICLDVNLFCWCISHVKMFVRRII